MVNAERRQRPGLGWLALIALALTLVLPPVAVSIAPDPPVAATLPTAATGTYRVYVADWGYHTAIILQQAATWQLGSLGNERAPFVEFAWGDRRFYMENNYRPDGKLARCFPRRQRLRQAILSGARPLSLVHRLQPLDSRAPRLRGAGARRLRCDLLRSGRRRAPRRRSHREWQRDVHSPLVAFPAYMKGPMIKLYG
jgi:hypothetical protein